MIKILFDTNVILDIALKREPFFTDSVRLFDKIDEKIINGFISATSVTDIYYIASKETDKKRAREFLFDLIQIVDIIGVDKEVIIDALESDIKDFEDAVQAISAGYNEIEIIVTRNVKDFINCGLEVLEPKELIDKLIK